MSGKELDAMFSEEGGIVRNDVVPVLSGEGVVWGIQLVLRSGREVVIMEEEGSRYIKEVAPIN